MTTRNPRTCVLKCTENKHMHAFPKDAVGRNIWLKQLGIKLATTTSFVCDRHFSEKMRPQGVGVKLTPWAIPDMNLPALGDSETDEDDMLEEEMNERPPDGHLNGYSMNDSTQDNNAQNDDAIDFDVLLAKVHRISDLTNNNKNVVHSIDDDESQNPLYDDDDMDSIVEYPEVNNMSNDVVENDDFHDEDTLSAPPSPVEINSRFMRRLIALVRRRRILYDPAHPLFSNIKRKTRAWERIASIQKLEATACRELWLNTRYDYQNHVRSLRRWLAGESNERERPRMAYENDLLFLWRHIADKSYCDDADDEAPQPRSIICHTPGVPDFPSSRDFAMVASNHARAVDHAYANHKTDESVHFACNLIEAVKYYSELYDLMHPNYGDAKRKSIIWDAISNELNEKATKCLWTWIQLQLRYEFEVIHNKSSYLVNKLDFLKKHILLNEKSPFKQTTTLTDDWYEPLNTSKEQHLILQTLLSTRKYRPFFLHIDSRTALSKDIQTPCWITIARAIKRKEEQCEITWIIMQAMYCELIELRRNDCRLRDEWEFESVITNLKYTITQITKKPAKELKQKPTNDDEHEMADNDSELSPNESSNEITFMIPGQDAGAEQQLVRFKLDTPINELPEKIVVKIDSVLENGHIVIMIRYQRPLEVYVFSLEKQRELIGEVMARPLLFNEPCKNSRLARIFWGQISVEMGYPAEACSFFWEYLQENSCFVNYDRAWKKSKDSKWFPPPNPIFEKFQKYADSKDWGEYINVLPDFVQEISNFPLIYVDLKINSSWNRRQCHSRDLAEVWSVLARKFAELENHKVVWDKLKQLFLLYMSEMELSMYNAWPKFWFPVLVKMKFLYELRYDPKDPIYYVIKEKIQDEIDEAKREGIAVPAKLDPIVNARAIFRLLKENEYLGDFTWVNRARFIAKMKTFPVLYNINHPEFGDKNAKLDAWQEMALSFHCTVGECHLIFQHLMKSYLLFRARDPKQMCRVNAKYWEHMTYIYSCAVPNAIDPKFLEGRSFRAASTGSTIKLAEEYQAEISLVDAKPKLILKNFAAAVNSLPIQIQTSVSQQIKYIFAEYARFQSEDIVVDV